MKLLEAAEQFFQPSCLFEQVWMDIITAIVSPMTCNEAWLSVKQARDQVCLCTMLIAGSGCCTANRGWDNTFRCTRRRLRQDTCYVSNRWHIVVVWRLRERNTVVIKSVLGGTPSSYKATWDAPALPTSYVKSGDLLTCSFHNCHKRLRFALTLAETGVSHVA